MTKNEFLRNLPKVDDILRSVKTEPVDHEILKDLVVEEIGRLRRELLDDATSAEESDLKTLVIRRTESRIRQLLTLPLRRVINGTGVILHTNLGRSIFRAKGIESLLSGYCNLELSIETGERGDRNEHVSELLRRITGCEAAIAVNNNAAAVMLVLAALAKGRTVVVSRGEQVEIGGSFRIPDVAALSGADIIEVGTTNVTRASDYRYAIEKRSDCALILRVEPSNFAVIGQSRRPKNQELFELASEFQIPYYVDLGSGVLDPTLIHGAIETEYIEGKNIKSLMKSADLLSFSGDKLIGSTQAGLIVGKKKYIDQLKRHPLYRAMRLDKATIAILCSTLIDAIQGVPSLLSEMLTVQSVELRQRAMAFVESLGSVGEGLEIRPCELVSAVGGGTFAHTSLPSFGIEIRSKTKKASKIAEELRLRDVPIQVTIERDVVRIDFRTILPQDLDELRRAICSL
ncbi:MAG: L-seryl-tRNA(Sec) selenium transferase [Bacillota bacterium]|nr:L-seryl-tRNA(Sec) selenium transferase [Bacillota bacterium]